MSLATLKVKVQKLIEKAKLIDYMWYNTPFDYVLSDKITDEVYINSYMLGIIPDYITSFTSKRLTNIGNQMFSECPNLTKIDMPNVTTIETSAIYNTPLLKTMIIGTLTQATNTSFRQVQIKGRGALETLVIGANTTADLYLQWSHKYPQSVLHNIIDNLADKTGQTTGIIDFGDVNLAKISDEYKAKLQKKNWEYK
jgi:FlaA1/EpsC-like NDP-sugar epimerase